MKSPVNRILCTLAGLTAMLGSQPSLADDSEVFLSSTFTTGTGVRPNVLFIMDTSGSMDSDVVLYDKSMTYTGSCNANYVYWGILQPGFPPDCTTTTTNSRWPTTVAAPLIPACRRTAGGNHPARAAAQHANPTAWVNLSSGADRKVECENDGNHGDTIGQLGGQRYAPLRAQWQRYSALGRHRPSVTGSAGRQDALFLLQRQLHQLLLRRRRRRAQDSPRSSRICEEHYRDAQWCEPWATLQQQCRWRLDLAARVVAWSHYPITELRRLRAPPCPRRSIPDAGWL